MTDDSQDVSRMGAFSTPVAYVAQFYPLWLTDGRAIPGSSA